MLTAMTRRRQPVTGWVTAIGTSGVVAAIRYGFGPLLDGAPYLVFFPTVIVSALVGGWGPGLLAIGLSVCTILTVEPPGFLLNGFGGPTSVVVFILIGSFDILLIDSLSRVLRVNARQQDAMQALTAQQETMFREMQHRVGNNMQFIASMLSLTRRQLPKGSGAEDILDEAIGRIASFARLHLKLHDIATYDRGLDAVLHDVLAELFAGVAVDIRMRVEPVGISMDQMTALVMIVVEAATNAIKHVFRHGAGTVFDVQLQTVADDQLLLLVHNDGLSPDHEALPPRQTLGLRIMHGFAQQLNGTIKLERAGGMTVHVAFPRAPSGPTDPEPRHPAPVA
jgi:two-component sensor histidine kinase